MKYRKKPVEIEARQWDGTEEDANQIIDWVSQDGQVAVYETFPEPPYILIQTLEGVMSALPHDYIIRGVKGEFYPCKPWIFKETYEAVE